MKYAVACSVKPDIRHRVTFVEVGFQFAKLGGVLFRRDGDVLSDWFREGALSSKETAKVLTDTTPLSEANDDNIHTLLPELKQYPDHWAQYRDGYRAAYAIFNHGVERLYGWFGETFSPYADLASAMDIPVVDFADPETLRRVEDFSMNEALQF